MNIKDIASLAGVSISTVSRVINNTAPVNEAVRKKVEAIIDETGYRPSSLAREMQTNRTNLIGVLISVAELNLSSIGPAINAITDHLKENGFNILLANSRFDVNEEIDFLRVFQEKRVDGIIYFSSGLNETHHKFLQKYPVPMVIIGQESEGLDYPTIVHDDFYAAKAAVKHLLKMGHVDIGYIGAPVVDKAAGKLRYSGYQAALEEANISENLVWTDFGDFTLQSGYEAMKRIHQRGKLPTGIFAATDFMAMGAARYLNEKGIIIPETLSIIGFDDVNVAAYYNPPLTTIHTDSKSVGDLGAKIILDMIEGVKINARKYVVGYELIERMSVKKLQRK